MNDPNNLPTPEVPGTEKVAQTLMSLVKQVELQARPESRLFPYVEGGAIAGQQFRLLHARLMHIQSTIPFKRLLITSAVRGEGKSHVSTNLALTFQAESDRKVLLVDADIRKPDVHRIYDVPNDFGLTDVLKNGRDPWKAIHRVSGTNLFLLTAGSALSQPLTASAVLTLKLLLDQMSPAFDLLILDSPPLLMVADMPLLARLADAVLLVVHGRQTPRQLVAQAKGLLEGRPILGTVLTRVDPMRSHYSYYYVPQEKASKQGEAKGQKILSPKSR